MIYKENERLIEEIKSLGDFSEKEIDFIIDINESVMDADGTAYGYAYEKKPFEYAEISVEIYEKAKTFFVK